MDHVLRAVDEELARGPYYHASDVPLPVGEVLTARRRSGASSATLDARRPVGVSPRNDNWFMVKDPTCLEALGQDRSRVHVYRVTPTEPVTKANFKWFRDALLHSPTRLGDGDLVRAAAAADNYWRGAPGPHCWDEYLTTALKIDEEVGPGGARLNAVRASRSKSPTDTVCDPSSRPLPSITLGQRVRVHLNLHNGCYAVTVAGKVVGYARAVRLRDATTKVSKSGYESCRDEHVRNVHAYLEGTLVDFGDHLERVGVPFGARRVSYNCLSGPPCFYYVDDRSCFTQAGEVLALPHGSVWVV